MALFSLEDSLSVSGCDGKGSLYNSSWQRRPFLDISERIWVLGRGGPQGLQGLTGPGSNKEARSRAGEGTRMSPGAESQEVRPSGRDLLKTQGQVW